MRVVFKILLCLLVNAFILKSLFISAYDKYSGKNIYIKKVYSKPGYKYWAREDGTKYCRNEENTNKFDSLSEYSGKKTNVIFFENVNVIDCLDQIEKISIEFHKYGLEIAFPIEIDVDYAKAYVDGVVSESYYREKYSPATSVNDWVDYIVFVDAMHFFDYNERREIQVVLRDIFKKPYLGFLFNKKYDIDPESIHPNREDKKIIDFLPKDDDGDFIITEIKVDTFRRTLVFAATDLMDTVAADGEFH